MYTREYHIDYAKDLIREQMNKSSKHDLCYVKCRFGMMPHEVVETIASLYSWKDDFVEMSRLYYLAQTGVIRPPSMGLFRDNLSPPCCKTIWSIYIFKSFCNPSIDLGRYTASLKFYFSRLYWKRDDTGTLILDLGERWLKHYHYRTLVLPIQVSEDIYGTVKLYWYPDGEFFVIEYHSAKDKSRCDDAWIDDSFRTEEEFIEYSIEQNKIRIDDDIQQIRKRMDR